VTGREQIGKKAVAFFEDLWKPGDHWDFENSEYEQIKYERQLGLLGGTRYARALEIGCAAGHFTRLLARLADTVVGLDIAPSAIARARAQSECPAGIDFRVANIMDYDVQAEGPWDLVVMSETIYYLGWLYPFFDVSWLAHQLFTATGCGGRFLMANTHTGGNHHLTLPWVLHTYRDLFLNVGYRLEAEVVLPGAKNGVEVESLITLFAKPAESSGSGRPEGGTQG
jgi:SAM-dependent methyltransferase